MQKRHSDRLLYFNEQIYTTRKYVIPFIEKHHDVTGDMSVLEIGCGEGGNLQPFLDLGCKVTGIDICEPQINKAKEIYANHPNKQNLTLICEDIYKVTDLDETFDIIIIRDVIEHIPNQERFLPFIKRFLNPYGVVFVAFPPWQNPFGGHQQICNNKFLSHLPWVHLLPRSLYKKVLEWGNVQPDGLLDIKDTGISLERFLSIVNKEHYHIKEETLYFINPNYEIKFKLRPRKLWGILNIPYIRNFYTTCGYYLLDLKNEKHAIQK
ncbi:bifunctional 2-polyprenyl-6-hydroxyphenol methylase/3-demethylubiquinol 3-O-methyltransferase UbiG [Parabacteroides sp. AM08-6]|uniref:class I SAM-dependent methyltransferase n=1 Tax=Parabacteroides sp. AM08-6 TaxID=2292053 RepID=UPI000EFEDEC6|nr:class I SAM-dependent methyltransferase [Parabacteroides sp. AM08-6]RHJ79733.1 class I SAM-dependent methyltransferase [Parabacteroides sp. AM08-6]